MAEECTYARIPQGQATEILEKIIRCRENHKRPDDVNALARLFAGATVRKDYLLDYEVIQEGEAGTRIRPVARKIDGAGVEDLLLLDILPPELEGFSDQDVEKRYQFLMYERSPRGLFQYAFCPWSCGRPAPAGTRPSGWLQRRSLPRITLKN